MDVRDLTFTSLETITGFDVVTGDHLFTLDELQNSTIANSEEKEDITGKGGRKLGSLKKNKAVTVSGSHGLISGGLLSVQTGSDYEEMDAAPVMWTDYLTITDNKAVTSYKAVGTTGNEIETVYIKNDDGTLGEKLTQNATADEGKFAYNPDSKEITFKDGDYKNGTEIAVFYIRNVKGGVVTNVSDVYSKKCTLYIDVFAEDKCNNVFRVQFYIPKADFSGNFDIAMGDSQTVHSFEAESIAGSTNSGACKPGTRGQSLTSGLLWTYTVFGADAEDAA